MCVCDYWTEINTNIQRQGRGTERDIDKLSTYYLSTQTDTQRDTFRDREREREREGESQSKICSYLENIIVETPSHKQV